ncbi:hypothetical protein [Pseudoclavibacter sp. VKM Ac-2888]|uniref:hypothetical protein n=1 Tax=Pseudoclavibacter sp. VKM Ac-2888 TaxID=2783830 RepID=UPI00188B33E8|nr:hypothetical protein [Pseudoclavibacter sp. VKM Ac-2888]MBF4552071.1 hypothetical protein [Pseudoclavibacter sp. VKM Ac-2888]
MTSPLELARYGTAMACLDAMITSEESAMGEELEIIGDNDGLTIIGRDADIDRFLVSSSLQGERTRQFSLQAVWSASTTAGAAAQVGASILENSGRWVKLTAESAAKVKKYGLTPTKIPGVSHAMIGRPGDIKNWVQIAQTPSTLLAGPFALSALGTMMQQRAMQQQMDEITEYLEEISDKVDDILRAQTDAVLADMVGVDVIVEEAMTVREHTGRVSEVTWSKVQGAAFTIARTQAYAIRQLSTIAEKLAEKADLGEAAKATREAEPRVREWLAVLARTMQLQDAVWVLELDRVLDGNGADMEAHRAGLAAARANRIELVGRTTMRLLAQMGATVDRANSQVLLNPFDAPAAVRSSNVVSGAVVQFLDGVGLDADHESSDARRWRTAVAETGDRAVTSGVAGVRAAGRAGVQGLDQVTQPFRAVDIDGDGVADRPRAAVAAEQAGDALKGAASGVSGAFKTFFGRAGRREVQSDTAEDESSS